MKASIKIILKKTKLSNGTYPINLRVTISRKSKFYKTPYNVLPKFWNEKTSEFNSKYKNHLQSNRILSSIKQDASKILDTMIEERHEFTLDVFDSLFRPEKIEQLNFISFFEKRKNQFYESGQISSHNSYNDTISALKRFNPSITSYPFSKIDYTFLVAFEANLRAYGCNDGGIGVYMRNIRAIYNSAIKAKIASRESYPFKDYIISKLKSSKIKKALTKQDLQLLLDYDFSSNKQGTKILYTYLFSFYCRGMNFTDIAELRWDDIDLSNFTYIRNKTQVQLNIKIPDNDITRKIINYFKTYRPFDTEYIFPILKKDLELYTEDELKKRKTFVLNYYGKQLNKIALECGIKTKLNFYTARHTFATLSLKKGLSTVMIKQALGHKSIQTTETYLEDFRREELDLAFEDIM
ncbi:site-specific integrase [Lutibacter sp. A80]|uniref:site-specific integrase n=1 Tax=Lutibacter sp. A80 TaxID=2918453 RepID=UPI001F05B711|nr:site-specific integrase [Lutibacter sp. A80]UMB59995.1 site-specific integrase [Lutibacter sp. A80]